MPEKGLREVSKWMRIKEMGDGVSDWEKEKSGTVMEIKMEERKEEWQKVRHVHATTGEEGSNEAHLDVKQTIFLTVN